MEIHSKIRQYIIDNFLFGLDEGLSNSASLLDQGIIDSTGVLELVAHLEKTFGIKVNDNELVPENLDSVDAIVGFLGRKRQTSIPARECLAAAV
jgi:acyl carrier protein